MLTSGLAFLNHSTLLSDGDAQKIVAAVNRQLTEHVGPSWSRIPPRAYYCGNVQPPPNTSYLAYVDDSDQADALGYHTVDANGIPSGIIGIRPVLEAGGGILTGPQGCSVACVSSHEGVELTLDPWVGTWVQDANGVLWSMEGCDWLEGVTYPIDGVDASDFILPVAVNPFSQDGPYSWCKSIDAPFTFGTRGYAVTMKAGVRQQIGAARPSWKLPHRSRSLQRLAA